MQTVDRAAALAVNTEEQLESLRVSHLPWRIDVTDDGPLRVDRFALGDPWVVNCTIGAMEGSRRRREIGDSPGEYVGVLLVRSGREVINQSGRTAVVTAGTAALWDGVRPVECRTPSTLVKHTMFVPRALLADVVPDLEAAVAVTIPPSDTMRLLFAWLDTYTHQLPIDSTAAHTAGQVAMELLRAAVAVGRGGVGDSRETIRLRITDFLDRNLSDPDLTLDAVAAANSISLRYLHLLFHANGESPNAYLRRRRLERAHALLCSAGAALSITEIAARTGFSSPSSFSRAYRARFGVSPREYRSHNTDHQSVHAARSSVH